MLLLSIMSTSLSAMELARLYNACATGEQAQQLRNQMHQSIGPTARYRVLPPSWIGTYASSYGWSVVDMLEQGDGHHVASGSLREMVRWARDLNRLDCQP